ncbi:MAG: DUF4214 domain-containing protein [Snowella sp.]|nr:DUF4214 domain-containing protein [Snowella sp.]
MATDSNTIVGLYVIYYGRSPDPSGLAFWEQQPLSATQIAAEFGTSAEAKQLYPFLAAPTIASPTEFITQVYENAFGRVPDAGGLAYWTQFLQTNNSPTDIATFILTVAEAAVGSDAVTLQNRADVALDFTTKAVNGNVTFDQGVASTSNQIIATVTSDPATVTAAEEQSTIAIADIIAGGGGGGGGRTFTLLENGAFLSTTDSNKVTPANQFLSASNDTVNAAIYADGSSILDPSTSDADVLNAIVTGFVLPNVSNIETINLTGAAGAINLVATSGAKVINVVKGSLEIRSSDTAPIELASGYADTLTLTGSSSVVGVNGSKGFSFVNSSDNTANLNIKEDSVITKLTLNGQSKVVVTGDKNLTVSSALDSFSDTFDASALKGTLSFTAGENFGGFGSEASVTGGTVDDTFTFVATTSQINGVTLDGGTGKDALTVKVGNTPTALDLVTNVETITFQQAGTVDVPLTTTITTVDDLVAKGATLAVDASVFTTDSFSFKGAAETDGSFNIKIGGDKTTVNTVIGGDLGDTIVASAGTDLLTGGKGADTLTGGTDVAGVFDTFAATTLDQSIGYTFANGSVVGTIDNKDTLTFKGSVVDMITDFKDTDVLQLSGGAGFAATNLNGSGDGTTLFAGTNYYLLGSYSGGTFTVDNTATGTDTLILQGDGSQFDTINGNLTGIVLQGVKNPLGGANFV